MEMTDHTPPRPRVLVVDDDENARLIIRATLRTCDISEASDGHKALTQARLGGIDLVIQDMRLPADNPGLTGMRLVLQVRKYLGPAVKVLVITGHDDEYALAEEAGFFALMKPLDPDELRKTVDKMLGLPLVIVGVPILGTSLPKSRPVWLSLLGWVTLVTAFVTWGVIGWPPQTVIPLILLGAVMMGVGASTDDALRAVGGALGAVIKKLLP